MAKAPESLGVLARGWVEDTHGQVARELGILQEAMLERVDQLASELASASHEELAEVEGVQAYAESFLVDAGQLLELLATRLDTGLGERLEVLLKRAEDAGEAGVEARLSVARWRRDARHYLTFVAQYVAGYVQGGGVALGLMLEMPEGPIDRAVITSIVRHRLMFAADRAELAATRWAEEIGAEIVSVARQLDGDAAPTTAPGRPVHAVEPESFDLFGPDESDDLRSETLVPGDDAPETEAARLERLLGMAAELGVKVRKVPKSPSHSWLDKMQSQLEAVAEKRKAQEATLNARKARLAVLLSFAAKLKVKVKKVPERPSEAWLDKMEVKLVEVAGKKGVAVPSSFAPPDADAHVATGDPAPEREVGVTADAAPDRESVAATGDPAPDREAAATGDLAPSRDGGARETSDAAVAREAGPSRISPAERRSRIDAMLKKADKAGLDLGNVPDEPSDDWVETTEERLDAALAKRKAERKAAREKKKRERDARISRLTEDAKDLGIEMGPVPKFPTEDWLSRMEMKIASMRMPEEEKDSTSDDRAGRLKALLEDAEAHGVDLGEVPPDPDNVWLSWGEGRLRDAEASEELIAAGEDPEDEPAARPRVVFEEGTVQERVWVMEEAELTIGRARGNHVQIRDDRGVSRLHCTIFERDGDYFVRDNGSTKGTLVDGHLVVDDQLLDAGTRVTLGDTEMVFRV